MDINYILAQLSQIIIVFALFAFILGGLVLWGRYKNQKAVAGKILCHFFGASGWYYVLCEQEGNKVKPPEGHHIKGSYLVTNDCVYLGKYPPGMPSLIQAGVGVTAYKENVDTPIISKAPDAWLEAPDKRAITAHMRGIAMNEAFMKSAQVLQTGVWKDIATMAQFIKNVPYLFWINIGLLIGLVIIGYLVYVIYVRVM